jgi:hypothetical protein
MKTKLGHKATDIITGFEGVITGRCEYLTGCTQLLLAAPAKDGAAGVGAWFDEQRCRIDEFFSPVALDNGATPGCDLPAPTR